MKWAEKPYHSLDYEMKRRFGEKVYRLALNGGMTCPNRDGTLGYGGCIFCSSGGSGEFAADAALSVTGQILQQKKQILAKRPVHKFIAYFQAYTNTYAPVEYLERIFLEAIRDEDIVALSVATRPDCLPDEVTDLLVRLKERFPGKFIWVELGLQTIHEKTASYIRRGYPLSRFDEAVKALHEADIPVIVHVILGLPGETREMMLQTIRYLNACGIWGIKLQLLHVLEGTDLAEDYRAGLFSVLSLEEYLSILCDCIAALSPDIVIHRLTGDGPKRLLIAPLWSADKRNVLNLLHRRLKQNAIRQGQCYESGTDHPL